MTYALLFTHIAIFNSVHFDICEPAHFAVSAFYLAIGTCHLSKTPFSGSVYCHQASTFGPRAWPLPAVSRPFPAGESRFRWFARFVLEGKVCPKLERFLPTLLSKPNVMNKSWANLQPRTNSMLRALGAADVDSKDKLKAAFVKDASFMKGEYLQWIPEALHAQVEEMWPPLKDS